MKVENLYKKFDNKVIFENYSFEILDKKINYLIGPSGCGKTTLLRILSGLDKNFRGNIDIGTSRVSVVFQEPRLFPNLTIKENIEIVCDEKRPIDNILKIVELENDANLLPNELSGGMKMRVSIARALACDSDLYLMDEPLSALDEDMKDRIIPKVLSYLKGKTIIIISHDSTEINKYSNNVVNLENNKKSRSTKN
jgi:NitT/TauT family transport system ATP-binding protein